jgi:hypothetical protein
LSVDPVAAIILYLPAYAADRISPVARRSTTCRLVTR